jgi:hypothetical protein
MDKSEKKQLKAQVKADKKQAKSHQKLQKTTSEPTSPAQAKTDGTPTSPPSPAVRFAEAVRGIIYIIFGASLLLAIILGQKGVIVSLDDIIDYLLLARIGKIVLVVIALALFIYGLKHLRLVK